MFSGQEALGLKIIIGIAGVVGAILHLIFERPRSVWAYLEIAMAGTITAVFITQPLVKILPLLDHTDPDTLTGMGFVVGLTGIFFTRLMIKVGRGVSDGDGFKNAIVSALTSYAEKKGGGNGT